MAGIGYHASHEQFAPGDLLEFVRAAENAGFTSGMCSDHFHPWNDKQGQSGFAFAWLGAALQATSLPFGSVCAPGQRYHPAVTAQAAATLAAMFPGRYWIALGSGENLNEHITGERWPTKPERNDRLLECVDVMRALWAGETVTHFGHIAVEDARLYTRPQEPPMIAVAALSAETAAWGGGWADALITTLQPRDELRRVIDAFREGGGEGKPMFLQVQLSFAPSDGEALRSAHEQWSTNILASPLLADLRMPADFEAAAEFVREEDIDSRIRVSSDPDRHAEWIQGDIELGFDHIMLHNVHRDQLRFLDVFGDRVLPALR